MFTFSVCLFDVLFCQEHRGKPSNELDSVKEGDDDTSDIDGASFMTGVDDDESSSDEEVCIPYMLMRC